MRIHVLKTGKMRSSRICKFMYEGIKRFEKDVKLIDVRHYHAADADVLVHYGMEGNIRTAHEDYKRQGLKAVYIDLGYWGRHHGGRFNGYHKVSVNARHPVNYFQNIAHPEDRFKKFGLDVKTWNRQGSKILLAGMSAKCAKFEGFNPLEWELNAIQEIRKHTDRPIVYRPKPSWRDAKPIQGCEFSPVSQPLESVLDESFCVVTHHSNVGCDGLIRGIPVFTMGGVALPMAKNQLQEIEAPFYPENRQQWANDVAYTQWSVPEMAEGKPWEYLRSEGLV